MKRTLYIVRHAKAEDRSAFMSDHDRDLVPEGIMASARMGRYLHEQGIHAGVLVSSTANRARDTAKVIAEQMGIDPQAIVLDEKLYEGGPKAYLAAVNSLPGDCESAMIFGHNPDVSYFAEYLTHQDVGSMSKGSVAAITFDNLNWNEVSGRTGFLAFYVTPKELLKQ
ncbi:histidine phosphatase family protein [Fibrella sp. HMF5335]|uniref:Histidine phosphatase family protein n=1 Tax=Fibrella rubiginis TaxID=2817060 RepID=A0A939GIB8_9BACT|nr:histidine phosphatase family protein [Fibrella rubiginis]MBO0939717.1 histidine phosphatase family protein [Fibrella rubiginis]